MTTDVYELLVEAKRVLGQLEKLEHSVESDRATHLVSAFIATIDSEPNANGIGKAAHALTWHLADQFDPLPESLQISELASHGRRIANALSKSHT